MAFWKRIYQKQHGQKASIWSYVLYVTVYVSPENDISKRLLKQCMKTGSQRKRNCPCVNVLRDVCSQNREKFQNQQIMPRNYWKMWQKWAQISEAARNAQQSLKKAVRLGIISRSSQKCPIIIKKGSKSGHKFQEQPEMPNNH